MNITIRQGRESDWQIIRDLNQSSFEANRAFDPYLDMQWAYSDNAKNYFLKALTAASHYVLIAEVNRKPVGYIILGPKQYDYRKVRMIELANMAILPEFRSKGIGAKMIKEAKKWSKEKGFQTIYVNAYIQNSRAVEFYKKQGFTPIDLSLEMTL